MKQKTLLKTMLLLCALIAGSGTMWAEVVTKSETFSFSTSGCTGWTTDNAGSYCGGYGRNKNGSYYVANSSITNFSSVDFSSVTNPSVTIYVKALTNGGTNEYTVSLINSSGTVVGTPVTKTGGMGSGSNAASASESYVTLTPVAEATGYRIDFPAKSAITQTRYTLTYTEGPVKTATTVTLDPTSLTFNLADGVTKNLSATVKAGNTTLNNADVTWSVSQGSDYASVTNTGVVSALAAGTAKIKASYAGDATYAASSAECTVTVNKATTHVTVSAAEGTIDLKPANKAPINLSAGVKAVKSDESMIDISNPAITWSVQSGSDYVDVSNTGVVTGKAVGTATIRASYAGDNNYYASYLDCQITVTDTRTAVNMSSFSATTNPIVVGNTTGTTVTTDNENWTPAYTYSSTNTGVATIAADGTITAVAKGTTTIRATLNIAANNADYILGSTTYKEFELTVNNASYTATFSVNGDETRTASVEQGQPITFPTAVETTPGAGEFPKVINSKVFKGWVTSAIGTPTDTAPTFIDTDNTNMGGGNITYYAVYAKEDQVESDNVNDATLAQTLQHGSWTPTGDTDSKTAYTLFGNGAYVESAAFDLSKLMKVKVYGGTYGGENAYKMGTITDGTNKWLDFELTGTGNTKEHSFTGGSALTGTKALRIASTCGNGSNSGLRMSKIEIFVKGVNTTYSKYSTTVSMLPIPEITMSDVQMAWGATDKSVAPTATINGEAYQGSFIYESSSANLTVASDGKLTCNVPGSYKVTARIAGTGDYQEAEKECNVIVTKQDITIAFPNNNADVDRIISNTASDNKFSQAATVAPAAYDGTVTYAISGNTNGASITGTEVTYTKSGTITVTATAPATEKYNGNSASYDLDIYYADIAQVKALTSSATEVSFAANLTDAVVTYVKDNFAYIQDASAAVMVNVESHGLKARDKINGKVTGTVKASNQIDVLIALDKSAATVTENAEIPSAEVKTLAEIKNAGTTYDGKLVTVNTATVTGSIASSENSGASIKDGSQIESTDVSFNIYAPNTGITVNANEKGIFTGFVSIYNGTSYRLNLYEQSQFAKTHNAPTAQTLTFDEDVFDIDEDTNDFTNFTPQAVSGAQGTVTYAIANTSGDVIYDNFNTADGTFTLKTQAYGTATITATAAAANITVGGVTTPYTAASKTYTVTVYPRYTSTFSINGDETEVRQTTHGATITVPTLAATVGEYYFVGWKEASAIAEPTNTAPTMVTPPTTPTSNVTYYAVYAIGTGTPVVEHTSTFTIKQASAPTSPYVNDGSSWTWANVTFINDAAACINKSNGSVTFTLPSGGKAKSLMITKTSNSWANDAQVVLKDDSNNSLKTFSNSNGLSYTFTSQYDHSVSYTMTNTTSKNAWTDNIEFKYETGGISYSGYRTSLPTATITLASACTDGKGKYYGTYSSSSAFVVSSDITVSEISVIGGELRVGNYEAGAVVPANTGVMVSSTTSGAHTVIVTTGGTSVLGNDNMLKPSGDAGITAANMSVADTKFYRLTMHNGTQIGYWWGAENGAAFDLAPNKAYLAVPNSAAGARIQGLWFDDATAIENVNVNDNLNGEVYDLQGRRVATPQKGGLYIVNGRKVVIK